MKKILALAALFFLVSPFAFAADAAGPFVLSYADAESAIGFALTEKGAGQNISATINGLKNDTLYSYDKPISVEIRGLRFDKESSRWSASLMFVANNEVVSAVPVAGRFEEMMEVPVLKREAHNGDIITGQDIEFRLIPVSRTRTDTVSDLDSLIGKSPLRAISPGRPIRDSEIVVPSIVKKDAMVTIRFSTGGMELSTTGETLDEGAKGAVISVRNVSSKKIIRAVVQDANTVTVSPPQETPYASN